jgi:alkyl sulfatase BDS1-like metallo-beta-lactamase superfamily hydrolase
MWQTAVDGHPARPGKGGLVSEGVDKAESKAEQSDLEPVEVITTVVGDDGTVVIDDLVAEVDEKGNIVATDERVEIDKPDGTVIVDETFSIADEDGGLRTIDEETTVTEP